MSIAQHSRPLVGLLIAVAIGALLGGTAIALQQASDGRSYPSENLKGIERKSVASQAFRGFTIGLPVGAFGGLIAGIIVFNRRLKHSATDT